MADDARRISSDRPFYLANAALSAAALGLIAYLLLGHRPAPGARWDLGFMPAVDASFNGLAALFICAGLVAIRKGARRAHRNLMISAAVSSALFFACYTAYHYVHGDTHFVGSTLVSGIYFTILASHILLSMVVVPLVFAALWFALRGAFDRHKKVTRILYPMWLYVSVTGVAIYFFLRNMG